MTTILFNLVLLALALDLIIWGIDQGWCLINRYKTGKKLKHELLTKHGETRQRRQETCRRYSTARITRAGKLRWTPRIGSNFTGNGRRGEMRKNQIDLGLTYMSSAIKKIEKEIIPACESAIMQLIVFTESLGYKMTNDKDLFDAMMLISKHCQEAEAGTCTKCIFHKKDKGCGLVRHFPNDWAGNMEEEQ